MNEMRKREENEIYGKNGKKWKIKMRIAQVLRRKAINKYLQTRAKMVYLPFWYVAYLLAISTITQHYTKNQRKY